MERNRQTKQARVEEKETDHAEKRLAIFEIDFSSRRNQRCDDSWINNVIEYGEISPVGGEKWAHATIYSINLAALDRRS